MAEKWQKTKFQIAYPRFINSSAYLKELWLIPIRMRLKINHFQLVSRSHFSSSSSLASKENEDVEDFSLHTSWTSVSEGEKS